jgi:hypothetical protein
MAGARCEVRTKLNLSGAKISRFPWRHLNVHVSRRPHTSRINTATAPLLDPIVPECLYFCVGILYLFGLIYYSKALLRCKWVDFWSVRLTRAAPHLKIYASARSYNSCNGTVLCSDFNLVELLDYLRRCRDVSRWFLKYEDGVKRKC